MKGMRYNLDNAAKVVDFRLGQRYGDALIRKFLTLVFTLMVSVPAMAFSTIEIGETVLPATTGGNNTFTSILFDSPFAPGTIPNVFTMTTEDGADPCKVRIRNVTHLGFEAACLEPSNEDGNHPGMMLEYIAVIDGGVTVPLAGGGGSVEFRSACTTTDVQQYGNNCVGCSGARSYIPLAFTPDFALTPAFIAQLQTTENVLPSGDPSFLDIAVQTNSLDEAGVNIAIEQMEAGLGPLAEEEKICYLAVERTGCESLDFSSLGGNATPVPFNAVLGGNVDGHDNNCSAGEGAIFAASCFTSTPIAVAGKNNRAGPDGGMLRRCSVSNSEIILTFDEDQISEAERRHTDEAVSVFAFGGAVTTPVTLNQASIAIFGRKALFEWQTSAETFHLGFHLWGELNGEWVQLNRRLIRDDSSNNDGVKDYRHSLRLSREQADGISRFGLSSLDNSGYEEFYGPFSPETDYGEQANNEAVDWTATRLKFTNTMQQRGYAYTNGRWKKLSSDAATRNTNKNLNTDEAVLRFTVTSDGLHQLNFDEVVAHAPQWNGIAINQLSLSLNGVPRPRHIQSEDDFFNSGDTVTFVGSQPTTGDDTYIDHYRYQLQRDASKTITASVAEPAADPALQFSNLGKQRIELSREREYSALLNTGNPWYDSKLVSIGNPASKVYSFEISENTDLEMDATLDIEVFGAIDFPGNAGNTPDHQMQIRVNGDLLDELVFDGFNVKKSAIRVPANLLATGINTLTLTLPGSTGYPADIVLIDQISISTVDYLNNSDNYDFAEYADKAAYEVAVSGQATFYQTFAYRADGALSIINEGTYPTENEDGNLSIQFQALPSVVSNNNSTIRYAVGNVASWLKPIELALSYPDNLHQNVGEYLVISHPNFIGDELGQFVGDKQQQGISTTVIDWLEIVNTYGFGNNTPAALLNFLTYANSTNKTRYLLLVGGHTYDYRNIVGSNSITFIPAPYREVSIFGHTPTDNPYADLDGDSRPDFAIGRWPVRTLTGLQTIIKKNNDWQANLASTQYQDALLVSQAEDGQGLSFDKQTSGRIALPLSNMDHFDEVSIVSMEELINSGTDDPIANARSQIATGINSGLGLLSYSGHASTSAWGSPALVNTSFIQNLQNSGKPTIVMPQACYTTYYESPSVNTLAHQWLFSGDKGAVALHGASVLGEYRENAIFAERFLRHSANKPTIGEAIMAAKRELTDNNQMLANWALLGDPSLPLQ